MSLPRDLSAYDDCSDLFERAVQAKDGIRVSQPSRENAMALRARLHYFRRLCRDLACATNNSDSPDWNRSSYDHLVVRDPREIDGEWWLYIEPRSLSGTIEEL